MSIVATNVDASQYSEFHLYHPKSKIAEPTSIAKMTLIETY